MKSELSASEARRIAVTAQGFNALSRRGIVGAAQLRKSIDRLGLLQIDSVNVLVRAQYLPLFSRLGSYDPAVLDALVATKPRRFFEYWGHEASLLPIDCHPLLRWRMARALRGKGVWRQLEAYASGKRAEADALLDRIKAEGPLAASDVAGSRASKGMWVWSDAKHALEWLFWAGLVAATHRRGSFERVYDLPERVLPRPRGPEGGSQSGHADRPAGAFRARCAAMHGGRTDRRASPDGLMAGVAGPRHRAGCCDRPSPSYPPRRDPADICRAGTLAIRDSLL